MAPPPSSVASVAAPAAPVAAGSDEILNLPLKVVLQRLPAALTALVKSPGDGNVALPLQKVLKQLPQGAVRFTFGEIRQASPAGTFLEVATQDQTVVDLPLPEIISRISPAHLQRRAPSKQLSAPAEVANVFGPRGEPLAQPASETAMFRKNAAAGAKAAAAPAPAPAAAAPATPTAPKISMPQPAAQPKPAVPAPKIEAPKVTEPAPAMAAEQTQYFLKKDAAPSTEVLTVPLASLSDSWPDAVKSEIASKNLTDSSVALPMNRVESALKTGKIVFSWNDIGGWLKPESITNSPNAAASIELPLKVIAPLFISQHRPTVPQKKLAIGENIPDVFAGGKAPIAPAAPVANAPAAPPAATAPAATPIAPAGLPKPATPTASAPGAGPAPIAPAGLPKPIAPAGLPKPPATSPSLPKPPATMPSIPKPPQTSTSIPKPAPIPTSIPKPAGTPASATPAVAPAKQYQSLGELFGDAAKKDWSPKDIVQKTNQLKGVAGSMVSLQDGLMVAGELPAPFRAETTAAFLPQIFGRMGQYSKELHLGEMNAITVECQKAPLQIIKAGTIFFGVLGRAGEPLPAAEIQFIAAELAKQNK